MLSYSIRPALSVLAAFLGAFLVLFISNKYRKYLVLAASIFDSIVVLSLLPPVLNKEVIEYTAPSILNISPTLTVFFRVDPLGEFFSLLSTLMWVLITIYTIGYVREGRMRNQARFFFAFTMAVAAGIGLGYSGNFFTFFIFYEILSISIYPLIIHHETDDAMRAGRKYLLYSLFGGVLILGSTALTHILAGILTFSNVGVLQGTASNVTLRLLFAAFIVGFGVKSAIMPLHGWLPSSMIAPIPANALLTTVEAGVFGIARLVYNIYGVELMKELNLWLPLAYTATVTIIVASIYAMRQDNLKQRLAYSTVSQLSYVVLGIALLTPSGAIGGLIHIAHQAVMKNTLFFAAGTILLMTGRKNISEFDGLASSMPLTMGAFTIAALGVIGFPPLAGFITKWYLALGTMEAGQTLFLVVILVSAFLNAIYYLPPIYMAYFKKSAEPAEGKCDPPAFMLWPMIITALYVIILGMLANLPYGPLELVHMAVQMFL
jgi:multicomponent Na+:H+ antiporter subunit D